MIGQTISHYKILEKLGEGGMGVVYKAQDTKLDRLVALKFLPRELSPSKEERARFIYEAKAASALDHPSICTIHEVDESDDGQLYIVMAFYEGMALNRKLEKGPLKTSEAINIAIQVAEGLQAAHEKKIVHRDIKSGNIILTDKGQAKILDFGLARKSGRTKLTRSGATVGTAAYMSPEQAKGENADERSDLWSLGVVLYEMLTGRLPFRGEHEAAVMYAIVNEEPQPIEHSVKDVSLELIHIVRRALEKSPSDRYQSASDMLIDLKRLRRDTSRDRFEPVRILFRKRRLLWVRAGATLVLALLALLFLPEFNPKPHPQKSIAVLPLKNLSDTKEDEYFTDGITEDIITQLSKIANLKVISRTSTMRYKTTAKNLKDIGKELDVATILEGSIRRVGQRVRIAAQLIDANTDRHLWAETYDRDLADIFAVQAEVAQQVASALIMTLSPEEQRQIVRKPTANLTAYDFYLKGREYYRRYTPKDNETGVTLLLKAVELDSNFALAYAAIADAYALRVNYYGFERSWLDSSIAMSRKALMKDSESAEAHKSLGLAYAVKGWLHKSLEEYRLALKFNPNLLTAIGNMGDMLSLTGDLVEGVRWRKKATQLNPTSAMSCVWLGTAYRQITDDANAEKYYLRAIELQPDLAVAYDHMFIWSLHTAQFDSAEQMLRTKLSINRDTLSFLLDVGQLDLMRGNEQTAKKRLVEFSKRTRGLSVNLAYLIYKSSHEDSAQRFLEAEITKRKREIAEGNENPNLKYQIARHQAALAKKGEALEWLQKAIDGGWVSYRFAIIDYPFKDLRKDPEFRRIIEGLKRKVDNMKLRLHETEVL